MEKVEGSGRNLQQSQSTGLGFFFFNIYLFTYLATLVLATAHGIFHCSCTDSLVVALRLSS